MLAFILMRYSTDLRKRILDFINNGGSKAAAERTFGVSRRTIYNYLEAEDPLLMKSLDLRGPNTERLSTRDLTSLIHSSKDF